MRCRECGLATRVLATRENTEGFVLKRTRTCTNGHKFNTYEIDDTLEGSVQKYASSPARIATLHKTIQLWWRNKRIVERLQMGEKHAVVALEYGLSPNMVSTIARRAGLPNAYEQRRTVLAKETASR